MTQLSILIPCIPTRNHRPIINSLCNALGILYTENFPTGNEEVEILTNFSTSPSGAKRQALMEQAKGKYICFLDDDDTVSPLYISSILQGTLSDPDVISFDLQFSRDGRAKEIWKFGLYPNNRRLGLMSANHLCAWRKEIATRVAWCPDLGKFDDHLWFEPLHAAKLAKTCYYINDVLYYYWFSTFNTINQSTTNSMHAINYLKKGIRFFFKDHEIYVEVPSREKSAIKVRDKHNNIHIFEESELIEFHKYNL